MLMVEIKFFVIHKQAISIRPPLFTIDKGFTGKIPAYSFYYAQVVIIDLFLPEILSTKKIKPGSQAIAGRFLLCKRIQVVIYILAHFIDAQESGILQIGRASCRER